MTAALVFACGHSLGDPSGAGSAASGAIGVRLSRMCPVCMLIRETERSRSELVSRAALFDRAAVATETRVGALHSWKCQRGHDQFQATILEILTGPGCPKCLRNAAGPGHQREAGVAFMNPGLGTRTSLTEQRLRAALERRIRIPRGVNSVWIERTFYGRREVWPDILIPELRIAIEYDNPGRGGRSHAGLNAAKDREKDACLAEVGWDVIRIRAGGLEPLGPNSIVCTQLTEAAIDGVIARLRVLRGDAAVDRLVQANTPESSSRADGT
ncbi:MAG TPA: hypothetical protein VFU07_05690 [Candidatus Lumbricidophila sp.]|nr:hypothetical protein [Candidatus Lumbricidophila sp.]